MKRRTLTFLTIISVLVITGVGYMLIKPKVGLQDQAESQNLLGESVNSADQVMSYTLADVAGHGTANDCWMVRSTM